MLPCSEEVQEPEGFIFITVLVMETLTSMMLSLVSVPLALSPHGTRHYDRSSVGVGVGAGAGEREIT